MTQRKLGQHHVLPENPEWIEFTRTDGDESFLPKNTERVVDGEGQVNFMRPVALDEATAVNWRVSVGAQVAVKLGWPEGRNYVIKEWPRGYRFYDHNKGPAATPRHDPYLCGSTLVNRFRSTNEFIPHAVWLMTDESLNRTNCECKYCAKKPQRVVTQALDLPSHRGSSHTPSKTIRRHRETRKPKPFAGVRRAPRPVKIHTGPEQALVPERDADIRHSLVAGHSSPLRWHRKGELVWCSLDPPIRGEEEDCIPFWPGFVDSIDVKTEPIIYDAHGNVVDFNNDAARLHAQPRTEEVDRDGIAGAESTLAAVDQEPPWEVRQSFQYQVKLLAVTSEYVGPDSKVLPYLAYAPSEDLLRRLQGQLVELMQRVPLEQMDADLTRRFNFVPVSKEAYAQGSPEVIARYKEAVAPFSLAVQIASNVAGFWGPTDEWECKFSIPSDASPRPPEAEPSLSLHALMNQAAENNAADITQRESAQGILADGTYRPIGMSDEEFNRVRTRILGQRLGGSPQIVTQTRYQGLWWGAERIWADELVRLKLARCQFAPEGTDVFYPPAGPSPSARVYLESSGHTADFVDDQAAGAAEKSLFMKLEGLFVVDVQKPDGSGMTKECRACGPLFELADEDFEDSIAQTHSNSQLIGVKGKGKERADGIDAAQIVHRSTPNGDGSLDAATFQVPAGPSFMSGPSPLRPPPLLNPDPTVPLEDTVDAVLTQTTRLPRRSKTRTVGAQLSHPILSSPYPLPPPPTGFKFRAIHPPGHEVVLSLPLISGRYYPGLFKHPLMEPVITSAFELASSQGGLEKNRHIWAMEGLVAGVYQSMDPTLWKPSRTTMFKDADVESRAHFSALWEEVKEQRPESQRHTFQEYNSGAIEINMY